jgi:PAS domain S-box-containing protein
MPKSQMSLTTPIDLSICENEPIRFPGTIQPHGVLLVLDPVSKTILAASESCDDLIGQSAKSLLGRTVSEIFGSGADENIQTAQQEGLQSLVTLSLNGLELSIRALLNQDGYVLLELETASQTSLVGGLLFQSRQAIETLRKMEGLNAITQEAANLFRAMTGFDRVMIYRFDPIWNGEVMAEAHIDGIESYLGLNFPASDIPKQARELFKECKIRQICDVLYTPSALVSHQDCHSFDLGISSLRSVSPLHIEYLGNMQVRATLVGSLVVDGQLWGLVSCQHKYEPKYFCPAERVILSWFCQDFAALIQETQIRERRDREYSLAVKRRKLVDSVREFQLSALIQQDNHTDLLEVVSADGFALLIDSTVQTVGKTPSIECIRHLHQRQRALGTHSNLFASNDLNNDFGVDVLKDGLAGALFVSAYGHPISMIWFRQERRYSVRWGGNPEHTLLIDDSGRLSPRKSFDLFLQNVCGQCLPWTVEELDSAKELGTLIEIEIVRQEQSFALTILNSSPDNIVVINNRGVITAVNTAWQNFVEQNGLDWLSSNSIGMSYRNLCMVVIGLPKGDQASLVWAGIQTVLNKKRDYFTLTYPCDALSERRWFKIHVYPMQAPCEGVVIVHQNYTESKRVQIERDRLLSIIEDAPDFIAMANMQSHLTYLNYSGAKMLGWSEDFSLTNMKIKDVHPEWATKKVLEEGIPAVLQHNFWRSENALLHKDGHEIPVSQMLLLHRDAAGTPQQVSTIMRDISEQKNTEQALKQAKETAEKANLAKSEFLANMSHEIRTPMNAIIGLSQLAINSQLNPQQEDYLSKILASSQHLFSILDDILDFSKIEANRLSLVNEEFDLDEIIHYLYSLFYTRAQEKSLVFTIDIDRDVKRQLVGDALHLQQILTNLLSNSIKFTEKGFVRLKVSVNSSNKKQIALKFSIEDSGIGISQAQQELLFKPFVQADTSITRRFGGTGLGLVISRRLAQLMGDDIQLLSQYGEGSNFWFNLEFSLAEHASPSQFSQRNQQIITTKQLQESARELANTLVLLVEDNPINQQVASEFLRNAGLKVIIANDGQQALELLAESPIEIVLMDIQMPVMDGLEATRQIRKQSRFDHIPILAMSAGVTANEQEKCQLVGMVGFISKPISPLLMLDTIAKALTISDLPLPSVAPDDTYNQNQSDQPMLELSGFDSDRLLLLENMLGGREKLLLSLQQFIADFIDIEQEITALLAQDNQLAVCFKLHAMKGAASNLGATELAHYANTLENALKQGLAIDEVFKRLCKEWLAICDVVQNHQKIAIPTVNPPENAAFNNNLLKLHELITTNKLVSFDLLSNLSAGLSGQQAKKVERLCKAIRAYDYDKALLVLKELQ